MGLPGHRRSSSHKRRRSAHFALKFTSTRVCATCGKPCLPHRVCRFCGSYKGRIVNATKRTAAPKKK